jgi:hypothetical protein
VFAADDMRGLRCLGLNVWTTLNPNHGGRVSSILATAQEHVGERRLKKVMRNANRNGANANGIDRFGPARRQKDYRRRAENGRGCKKFELNKTTIKVIDEYDLSPGISAFIDNGIDTGWLWLPPPQPPPFILPPPSLPEEDQQADYAALTRQIGRIDRILADLEAPAKPRGTALSILAGLAVVSLAG